MENNTDCARLDWLEDENNYEESVEIIKIGCKLHDIRGAIDKAMIKKQKRIDKVIEQLRNTKNDPNLTIKTEFIFDADNNIIDYIVK